MVSNSTDQNNEHCIKAGGLMVDIPSMQKGFQEAERYRRDIWDYIEYRESLVAWPSMNEKIKGRREKDFDERGN